MALFVNLLLMAAALALVGYPLMQPDSKRKLASSNGNASLFDSKEAALAETELDKALGKVEEKEYQMLRNRLNGQPQQKP